MFVAGIDVGMESTKVVIMKDGGVIGRSKISTGGFDRPEQISGAYAQALGNAAIASGDIEKATATGIGKYDVPFEVSTVTETISAGHAVRYLFPEASGFISVGADETIAATMGGGRLIAEYAINQKCTAGLGTFLKHLARRLEMTMEQAGELSGVNAVVINEGCVVFSELDALGLLCKGTLREAVMASATNAAAARAATVYNDLTIPPEGSVALIGGLAKNKAFAAALEKCLGFRFLINEDAEYCGAIGAALA